MNFHAAMVKSFVAAARQFNQTAILAKRKGKVEIELSAKNDRDAAMAYARQQAKLAA